MPKGRWLQPAKSTCAPRRILSWVVESQPTRDTESERAVPHVWKRAYLSWSDRRGSLWGPTWRRQIDAADACLDFIESLLRPKGKLYVFTPNGSESLTLCGFWERISVRGARFDVAGKTLGRTNRPGIPSSAYRFLRLVLSPSRTIVQYHLSGKGSVLCDCNQYLHATEADVAKSVGFTWPFSGGPLADGQAGVMHGQDRADLWLLAFQRLADWWLSVDGGPWGPTAGALSLSFLRKQLAPKTILRHDNPHARRLENAGIFGGRASVWYTGSVYPDGPDRPSHTPDCVYGDGPSIRGPLAHLDVASMYPHIMSTELFPVELLNCRRGYRVSDLCDLQRTYGVIASVRIESAAAEYPSRVDGEVGFYSGQYDTVLCGPELRRACADGCIIRVYECATYKMGRPFYIPSSRLITLRKCSRDSGHKAWELFCKLLSNSLAGKTAQKGSAWVERPGEPALQDWGQWSVGVHGTKTHRIFRAIAGMVWERVEPTEPVRPMGAAFAYLTSYGRYRMRLLRESLPLKSVLMQDTDSLVVDTGAVGTDILGRLCGPGAPGELRRVGTYTHARFFGPKHYWTDCGWTLSGLHRPSRIGSGLGFRDSYSINPVCNPPDEPPSVVYHHTRNVELQTLDVGGTVEPDGWVSPYHR